MSAFRTSKPMLYTLVDRRAMPCEDHATWGEWFARADRRVAETWVDDVRVSTIFLAIDHNPLEEGDPSLFETVVFVAGVTHHMRRYFIWEEAEAGHVEMVALIQKEMEAAQVNAVIAWEAVATRFKTDT